MNTYASVVEAFGFECWVDRDKIAKWMRLFRAKPPQGEEYEFPPEVHWDDTEVGDVLYVVSVSETALVVLQFWQVLEVEEELRRVRVYNLVGSSADCEHQYDRLAGLLGLPPSDPKQDPRNIPR